jgi:hypothetical protein
VEPKLGPRTGDYYPVISGLAESDRVVVRGNFLIDSQFQVTGKASLLYPQGSTGEAVASDAPGAKPLSEKEKANIDKLPPGQRELALALKTCPVAGYNLGSMGMPVKITVKGRVVFLCCKGCVGKAEKKPDEVLKKLPPEGKPSDAFSPEEKQNLDKLPESDRVLAVLQKTCPITGEKLGSMGVPAKIMIKGRTVFLCCIGCAGPAEKDPDGVLKKLPALDKSADVFSPEEKQNLDKLAEEDRTRAMAQQVCPVTDEKLGSMGVPDKIMVKDQPVFLCCEGCSDAVKQDPEGTLRKLAKRAQQTPANGATR